MPRKKYVKGSTVRIHNIEWFQHNKFNGKYTYNGKHEYPDKLIKRIAGKFGKILQYHENVELYDVEIGHIVCQVEETFFNDRYKYEDYDTARKMD